MLNISKAYRNWNEHVTSLLIKMFLFQIKQMAASQ